MNSFKQWLSDPDSRRQVLIIAAIGGIIALSAWFVEWIKQ